MLVYGLKTMQKLPSLVGMPEYLFTDTMYTVFSVQAFGVTVLIVQNGMCANVVNLNILY